MVNGEQKGFVSKRWWLNQGNVPGETLNDFGNFRLTKKKIEK
jgi:hypothetical protein